MFDNQQDAYHLQLQIEHSNVFELSDSSSESECDNSGIDSQHKYIFYIHVNDTFDTFEEVKNRLDRYAMERGFAVRKGRTRTREDGSVWNATWVCYLSGQWNPKKNIDPDDQRNREAAVKDCKWHCNFSIGNTATKIRCSLFDNDSVHNHPMDNNIRSNAPKYCRLTNEMINKVELYLKCNIQPSRIINLLENEYPDHPIKPRNIYNVISQLKVTDKGLKNDAADLLNHLLQQKRLDPGCVVEPVIGYGDNELRGIFWQSDEQVQLLSRFGDVCLLDTTCKTNRYRRPLALVIVVDNNTRSRLVAQALLPDESFDSFNWLFICLKKGNSAYEPGVIFSDSDPAIAAAISKNFLLAHHHLCVFHIGNNVKKKARQKFGEQYDQFMSSFYAARNALQVPVFESRYQQLIELYPNIGSYLKKLYESKKSWARCFTTQVFNAGIQSTQRVECYNNIIKKCVNQSSSLIKLYNVIQERLDQENKYSRSQETLTFNNSYGSQSISQTLFPEIITLCEKYLTPHITAEIKQQIQQALWYRCYLFNVLQNHCTDEPEFTNTCIEDDYDSQQIHINSLLNNVPYDNIKEAWRIVRLRGSMNVHYIILFDDGLFLCTCTWPISRGIPCRHYFAVLLESNIAIFHIFFIMQRWFKNIYLNEPEDTFYNISAIRPHCNKPAPIFTPVLPNQTILFSDFKKLTHIREASGSKKPDKKFLQDRIRYGKSYGLLQTVLTLAMETETNKEVNDWCYQFIQQKKKILESLSTTYKSSIDEMSNQNDQENVNLENDQKNADQENAIQVTNQQTVQVTNPKSTRVKGRPSRRQKSILELESKRPLRTINENSNQLNYEESSKHVYTCSNCHAKGHNIRSCNLPRCS